jgi:hypothetical protein
MKERSPVWKVATNISKNHHRQRTHGGPQSWVLGKVLTTPHCNIVYVFCYEMFTQKPQTSTDNLV